MWQRVSLPGPRELQVKEMKEFRILITDVPKGWDGEDWADIQGELDAAMNRWLSGWDYTISVWDVG